MHMHAHKLQRLLSCSLLQQQDPHMTTIRKINVTLRQAGRQATSLKLLNGPGTDSWRLTHTHTSKQSETGKRRRREI